METPALDPEMVQLSFYSYGFQYYVAGRFAVIAQLSPVAANLLHHAIEMLLKGELVHLEEKQRRDMGHDLTKLWPAYKKQMAVEDTLVSFDPVIEKLNKFEEIRYPDRVPSLRCRFTLEKAAETELDALQNDGRSDAVYELFLADIDALVAAILEKCTLNPTAYKTQNVHTNIYLKYENQETSL